MVTNPVARSHLSVHLFHSTVQSGIPVLLVHVMVAGSTLVPQPDTIVLDGRWIFLENLNTKYTNYIQTYATLY